ncbi:hypothetical protein [Bacillus sp. Marseille-P3661]|uniref:hypothetical protein n=1 Tax=Bacillus sp. Marseille-P3661 TaxID=1936234 RepID=UPI000C83AA70|nr:hypothetical protein [Bacillus sp. Marseille-P3661]
MSKRWLAAIFGSVFSLVVLTACGGGETEGDTEVIEMEEPSGEEAPVSGQPETEVPIVGEGGESEETENSDDPVPTTPEGQMEEVPSLESDLSSENEEPLDEPTSETDMNEEGGTSESDSDGEM